MDAHRRAPRAALTVDLGPGGGPAVPPPGPCLGRLPLVFGGAPIGGLYAA